MTKTTQHTPGFITRLPNCTDGDVILCPLHAAAPELLEAAKWGLRIALDSGMDETDQAVKEIRAAIAKAEGRS